LKKTRKKTSRADQERQISIFLRTRVVTDIGGQRFEYDAGSETRERALYAELKIRSKPYRIVP
jgi:hypothetical protein